MNLVSDPGRAAHTLHNFHAPSGGRVGKAPVYVNRRAQVGPDLWVALRTYWRDHRPVYVVAVVDNVNGPTTKPQEFPTLLRARNAANKLYAQLTEEKENN